MRVPSRGRAGNIVHVSIGSRYHLINQFENNGVVYVGLSAIQVSGGDVFRYIHLTRAVRP